jgi:vancomycin resistance protein YoaR
MLSVHKLRRINILVSSGQVFSFNQSVNDIAAINSYQHSYMISSGHTARGNDSGVFQVSITMFLAILNSSLLVFEWHSHDCEAKYYTKDVLFGLDAAIYQPTDDLKFKNDTNNYILIRSIFRSDQDQLTFNFSSTNDDRK